MVLRNGKNYIEFMIDFDKASKLWRMNKIYIGYGIFKYK